MNLAVTSAECCGNVGVQKITTTSLVLEKLVRQGADGKGLIEPLAGADSIIA
jgi:hypothetical protein